MRRQAQMLAAVVLLTSAGALAWLTLRSTEPVYQGKTLGAWLRESRAQGPPRPWEGWSERDLEIYSQSCVAVRQIGTNAIPTLLKMLRKKESNLEPLWEQHISQIPYLPLRIRFPEWYKNPAGVLNDEAALGFRILGTDAQQAIPALIKIYEQNISTHSQAATSRALNAIGATAQKSAIPSFLRAASNSNFAVREAGLWALAGADTQGAVAIPALLSALHDRDFTIRMVAAGGLARFGTNSLEAVPTLVEMLSDSNLRVRRTAANALMKIDPEAAANARVN